MISQHQQQQQGYASSPQWLVGEAPSGMGAGEHDDTELVMDLGFGVLIFGI